MKPRNRNQGVAMEMEPVAGFEPATDGLQNRCSTTELNWPACRVLSSCAHRLHTGGRSGAWRCAGEKPARVTCLVCSHRARIMSGGALGARPFVDGAGTISVARPRSPRGGPVGPASGARIIVQRKHVQEPLLRLGMSHEWFWNLENQPRCSERIRAIARQICCGRCRAGYSTRTDFSCQG
jgi:hypothetical protein